MTYGNQENVLIQIDNNELDDKFTSQLAEKALQTDLDSTNTTVAQKADKTYVDTQNSLKSDKTYTDGQLVLKRDKSILLTQSDLADELKQQIAGTTAINAVPAKGSLNTERFVLKGVNERATSFLKHGKNMFNKDTSLNGYLIDATTGQLTTNFATLRSTSDFIALDQSKSYYSSPFLRAWAFYDNTYTFISGGTTQFTNKVISPIPANAQYFRFSLDIAELNTAQLEEGTVATVYEPYKLILDKSDYNQNVTDLNLLQVGLGDAVDIGSLSKSTGEFTSHRNYSTSFNGWAYEFKKVDFSEVITRISAFINIGTNIDKDVSLCILNTDRSKELYKTTKKFSNSGKIEFNVKIPLSILTDTFYVAFKTDGTYGIMPSNANIDGGYITGGTYYFGSGIWSLASAPYNSTDIKIYTGYKSSVKKHTHSVAEITDLTLAANKVKLSLPDKYELIVGDKFELFYKGIILANDPYRFNINVSSPKGYAYKRKYEFTPASGDIGTHALTITIYNDDDVLLDTKTVNLIVKAKSSNPSSIKNVLCVGDSLTSGGQWVTELQRKLVTVDGLSNVKFVGTQGTVPSKYEGYGGWTFDRYLSNISDGSVVWVTTTHDKDSSDQHSIYQDANGTQWKLETIESNRIKVIRTTGSTAIPASGTLTWVSGGTHQTNIVYSSVANEASSPFWNETTNQVDFANYATELGITSIDHCYILLGWNNTTDKTETSYKASVRTFINELRADFPNSKVSLMGLQVPDIDGLGTNYGTAWNYKNTLKFVFEMNRWLKEVAAEYTNVDFVNLAGQFDSEYNMPSANVSVNARNTTTERRGYNGVHPANEGYLQIADVVYRNIQHKI